ncbi:MAG: cobyrinate a,c-diamide synthase [Clostridiales bacterium]|nr:cobyrinate a,c-diamide synthase [Clostridiales bacterium]
MNLPRIMLAAPQSGSGKTLVTCGLLQALVNRGIKTASFKCGPDYIDPMFHTKVIGTPSRNLDTFFAPAQTVRYLFARQAAKAEVSVMEGVMGFYDGVAGITTEASSWELADVTDTPVILVVNAKGMSLSVVPLIKGFLEFHPSSHIRGVILNQTSPSMYPELKREIERALPVQVLGCVPRVEDCVIESRHLGLVTPDELEGLRQKLNRLAGILEETLDIDGILKLAESAPDLDCSVPLEVKGITSKRNCFVLPEANVVETGAGKCGSVQSYDRGHRARIAVARDEAFCFYYEDNLDLLRELGAELIPFSPLYDCALPEQAQGILLGGGYPELYAEQLSANTAMLASIRTAIERGVPYLAECGGFMYLHDAMEDMQEHSWPMAGVLHGQVRKTDRLVRFGYITLTANKPQIFGEAGCSIRAHEFHYFDSTDNGNSFHAQKPGRKRNWECMLAGKNFAAGFPHLYYYSNPEFAARFVEKCRKVVL